jgi:hypothetical protein
MYKTSLITYDRYGPVIQIDRVDYQTNLSTPFLVVQQAIRERKQWLLSGADRCCIFIDEQIFTPQEAERWASEEYKSLPKCPACGNFLDECVYPSRFLDGRLHCSQACADRTDEEEMEKYQDEEEIDYL